MRTEWSPSLLGRFISRSTRWALQINKGQLLLRANGRSQAFPLTNPAIVQIRRGFILSTLSLPTRAPQSAPLKGLFNWQVGSLKTTLEAAYLRTIHQSIRDWWGEKPQKEQTAKSERRWFTHEMQAEIEAMRPPIDIVFIRTLLRVNAVRAQLGEEAKALEAALTQWEADHRPFWKSLNAAHTEREIKACKLLFEKVERRPLTEEQARAVICFDNRVQVVAAAGSGKTSVMIAKAAYAIYRNFVSPERIVMLAFNKAAATELESRAKEAFKRLGIGDVTVRATTFHSLGLDIIGGAKKKKPRPPDWVSDLSQCLKELSRIVEKIIQTSPDFSRNWDLYRSVLGRDFQETWDAMGREGILTADGKSVKSKEEAIICDWLFYHGVNYEYESPYKYNTANATYSQYMPDFYYPEIDLYHEHFALDAQGNPPASFKGYRSTAQWKRNLHQVRGTSLIETTSHQLRTGEAFDHLRRELTARGLKLKLDLSRTAPRAGQAIVEVSALINLVRIFISHLKSNCLTVSGIRESLGSKENAHESFTYRLRIFLDIVEPIIQDWDAKLKNLGGLDFEDMINLAAGHLECGNYNSPYDLIMVDEFQDASRARARLCRALVSKPSRHLFAVGDDWQSINRFAGADLSVMTRFLEWFGNGHILKLEETFRCPQKLCDISRRFVTKNPSQIDKKVRSKSPDGGPVLQAFQVRYKNNIGPALEQVLIKLANGVESGLVPPSHNNAIVVYVLGRYHHNKGSYMPTDTSPFRPWVNLSFSTIHSSKGSEADYVILPEMCSFSQGSSFPNTRADPPELGLVMPDEDSYSDAEERRLFYVALTRARRGVIMLTVQGRCSSFLKELVEEGAVSITEISGEPISDTECPACKHGVIVLKNGPYSDFYACSNYPICSYKP